MSMYPIYPCPNMSIFWSKSLKIVKNKNFFSLKLSELNFKHDCEVKKEVWPHLGHFLRWFYPKMTPFLGLKNWSNFEVVAFFSALLFLHDFYTCYTVGLLLQIFKNSGGVSKIKDIFLIIWVYAQFDNFSFYRNPTFNSL